MKRLLAAVPAILLLAACGGAEEGAAPPEAAPAEAAAPEGIQLGEVLVFLVPTLKAGADSAAFERYVLDEAAPAWREAAPGMELSLVRSDRGNRQGYMLTWATSASSGLTSNAPDSPFAPSLAPAFQALQQGLAPYVDGPGEFIEYHLVAPQTVGALPEVDILGMHFARVQPARAAEFEQFVADSVHPAVGNLRPDLRLLYYKAVRGQDESNYVTMFALTDEGRDKYWPGGSDSDSLRAAFSPEVKGITPTLATYLVEGSYGTGNLAAAVYESREYGDYVQVK